MSKEPEQLSLFDLPEQTPARPAQRVPVLSKEVEYHTLLGLIYYNGERDLICLTGRSKGKYSPEEVWSEGYVYPDPLASECPVCHPTEPLPTCYAAWKGRSR